LTQLDATESFPLVFYGDVVKRGSNKRAFLLDGDQIHIKSEGDLIEDRYRLTWIGPNSVAIDDVCTGARHVVPLLNTEMI